MHYLVEQLQNNALFIMIMFLITIISGLFTIILGWKKIYSDFLSKKITLQVWQVIFVFFTIYLITVLMPRKGNNPKNIEEIHSATFGIQRVVVDGRSFSDCSFNGTELVFRGEGSVAFHHCHFEDPKFTLDGPAATTMKILQGLYKEPSFRIYVENTLKLIMEGKEVPQATQPYKISN